MSRAEKIQRQDKLAVLKLAKEQLLLGHTAGVCQALFSVGEHGSAYDRAASSLRVYIGRELGYHLFLNGWLRENRPSLPADSASMLQYRLQWIDWMIADLEKP